MAEARPLPAERLREMLLDVERHQRAIARHRDALVAIGEEIADRIVEANAALKGAEVVRRWVEAQR